MLRWEGAGQGVHLARGQEVPRWQDGCQRRDLPNQCPAYLYKRIEILFLHITLIAAVFGSSVPYANHNTNIDIKITILIKTFRNFARVKAAYTRLEEKIKACFPIYGGSFRLNESLLVQLGRTWAASTCAPPPTRRVSVRRWCLCMPLTMHSGAFRLGR